MQQYVKSGRLLVSNLNFMFIKENKIESMTREQKVGSVFKLFYGAEPEQRARSRLPKYMRALIVKRVRKICFWQSINKILLQTISLLVY